MYNIQDGVSLLSMVLIAGNRVRNMFARGGRGRLSKVHEHQRVCGLLQLCLEILW